MHPTANGEREAPSVDLTLELRKDLLRLRQAESEGERAAILGRLFYYPGKIDYGRIVENHLSDKATSDALKKKREEWERSRAAQR